MTPGRLRECLTALGLSQGALARQLGCDDRVVSRWATGQNAIPRGIERWLEEWVAVRQAHPDPPPPEDWHGE
jgi:transcriptional regulator with XRE-family HTH domain